MGVRREKWSGTPRSSNALSWRSTPWWSRPANSTYPKCPRPLATPRVQLLIADGVRFMQESQEQFDVILVDSTDPIGPSQPLFGPTFYRDVYDHLNETGIVVSQGESIFYEAETQIKLLSILKQIFPVTSLYNYQNLTYPGSPWSFTFASKGIHPLRDFAPARIDLECEYYNQAIHRAAFALPSFHWHKVREHLSENL